MIADALPKLTPQTIVCTQVGNVNTGAVDPLEEIIPKAKDGGSWVHVDGAFGLWLTVDPKRKSLTRGIELAEKMEHAGAVEPSGKESQQ